MASKPVWTIAQIIQNMGTADWTPGTTIGYSFAASGGTETKFTATQQAAVKQIFSLVSDIVDLKFAPSSRAGTVGDISFVNSSTLGGGIWGVGGPGGVTVKTDYAYGTYAAGTYDLTALTHEIGHALGLSHPGNYNGGSPTYENDARYRQDSRQYTVMSYFDAYNTGAKHNGQYGSTFLLHDVATLQALYGANMATRTGDTVYGWHATAGRDVYDFAKNAQPVLTIWDAGGTDTIDLSGSAADQRLDLRAGEFSDVCGLTDNLAICFDVVVENGIGGSGNDGITGNSAANRLDGGAGADTLAGGKGNDTYLVDSTADSVVEKSRGGTDLVIAGFDYVLGGNVENLRLTGSAVSGTGNAGNNAITGNAAANLLTGGDGNDTLDGGQGSDTLDGGRGDDTFVVDDGGDVIRDAGGRDTIVIGASYTLGGDLENLVLSGSGTFSGTGTAGDNAITGNGAANLLTGADGNDTLDGGAGKDTLAGGKGDDRFVTDGGDTLKESSRSGRDTVVSSGTIKLAANFEDLVLAGTAAIDGTGNAAANALTGNAAANRLDGGAGADTMTGGKGDDTYVVSGSGDRIVEKTHGGRDTVLSAVTFSLAGREIEDLVLTGKASAGTGNGRANAITGNARGNTLDGGGGNDTLDGGKGNDTLIGGAGNDRLLVGSAKDKIVENAKGGHDTVVATVDYRLANANLEDLVLAGNATSGKGNDGDNAITGNARDNRLSGGLGDDTLDGGTGADRMDGGRGDDRYVVDNAGDKVIESADGGRDTVASSVSFSIAGQAVEALTLTGTAKIDATGSDTDNALTGNAAANRLDGGAGADTLDGGAGADTMTGGAGDDRFVVDDAGDKVIEGDGAGFDTVSASVSFSLAGQAIEALVLRGKAADGTGNALANTISGTDAANTLDGGAGADTLTGGKGDDTYVVDGQDVVVENANGGDDLVRASADHHLADNVERLTLTGSGAIAGIGNALDNAITGNDAANVLDGNGGADTLTGGKGDDTYVVDGYEDVIVEHAGQGNDTVVSAYAYGIAVGSSIENVVLTGTAYSAYGDGGANRLTGSDLANYLSGGNGNDTLDGAAGADYMSGGLGDDLYYADDTGDSFYENAGEGSDTVIATVSVYAAYYEIETVRLVGSDAIDATTGSIANLLVGNAAANRLDGGAGADTMQGGMGDDTYVVDDADDRVVEAAGEGTDTVETSLASYSLKGTSVENLKLIGYEAADGTGNAAANLLTGNYYANLLAGGAGDDTLIGGGGDDTLDGGDGNDRLQVDYGSSTLRGGAGNDTYVVAYSGALIVEAAGGGIDTVESTYGVTLADNIENLTITGTYGGSGTGNVLANVIIGGDGGDYLEGAGGADTVDGGAGNDTLVISSLADLVAGDVVRGGADWDTLQVTAGTDLTVLDIGSDIEQLYSWGSITLTAAQLALFQQVSASAVVLTTAGIVDFSDDTIYASTFTLSDAGNTLLLGGSYAYYTLNGGAAADVIRGGDNGDNIYGNGGDDSLSGGGGGDYLDGGAGRDIVDGGDGDDTLVVSDASHLVAGDQFNGGDGSDTLNIQLSGVDLTNVTIGADVETLQSYDLVSLSAAQLVQFQTVSAYQVAITTAGLCDLTDATVQTSAFDLLVAGVTLAVAGQPGSGVTINGSEGTDDVTASGYNVTAYGNGGDDRLSASADYATIDGGAGNDVITGSDGYDTLTGGLGADTLTGGGSSDYFEYRGVADSTGPGYDTLTDIDFADDRLDLDVWVSGYAGFLHAGTLSTVSFDDDLAKLAKAGGLEAYSAVLLEAKAGDLAGAFFLVVDANGTDGYQAGEDYVFRVEPENIDALGAYVFV